MVISARRQMANGVRNDIRSAAGLEDGGGANGDKNGLALVRAFHSGFGGGMPGGGARTARGGTLAGSRPGFSQKKPEKYFCKYVSSYCETTCVKNIFC